MKLFPWWRELPYHNEWKFLYFINFQLNFLLRDDVAPVQLSSRAPPAMEKRRSFETWIA